MSSSNINIAQEINELSLNTDNTAQQYACYLKKFAVFVGQTGVLTKMTIINYLKKSSTMMVRILLI